MCKEFMINGEFYCTLGSLRSLVGKKVVDELLSATRTTYNEDDSCLCDICPEKLGKYLNQKVKFDGVCYYFGKDIDKIKEPEFTVTII